MSFSVINEIYKSYISDDMNRDTEAANRYYNELFSILEKALSIDLQNKIYDLINNYAIEVEEKSFKDGFKYGVNLYNEI